MNRHKLIQHLRTLEMFTSEFRSDVENLGAADPFANFILRARRDYRKCSENYRSKGATGIKRFLEGSYKEALRYGFQGGEQAWFAVLHASIPDPEARSPW